jgi:hypothetical protein
MNEVNDMVANNRQGEIKFFADLSRDVQCW